MKLHRDRSEQPTAHASLVPLELTAASVFVPYPVDGAVTCDQALPFQWSMTAFVPVPLAAAACLGP